MPDREKSTGFAIGLLAGAALGLAVGILYAPRSGAETRAMVIEKTEEAKSKARDIVQEARERAKKIVEDAKGKAAEENK